MNQKLKPLNHKDFSRNYNPKTQTTIKLLAKHNQNPVFTENQIQKVSSIRLKPAINNKQPYNTESKKQIKIQRTSTKKIEVYDCNDFECQMEDNINNKYFEGQLQKNIIQEICLSTKKQPKNKALIVLPKLENDLKVKKTTDLQNEIDLQMSRSYQNDEDHLY